MSDTNRYVLGVNQFMRWIIVQRLDQKLAWSGSRWVPILGDIQICNFESPEEAHAYAKEAGLAPAFTMPSRVVEGSAKR